MIVFCQLYLNNKYNYTEDRINNLLTFIIMRLHNIIN